MATSVLSSWAASLVKRFCCSKVWCRRTSAASIACARGRELAGGAGALRRREAPLLRGDATGFGGEVAQGRESAAQEPGHDKAGEGEQDEGGDDVEVCRLAHLMPDALGGCSVVEGDVVGDTAILSPGSTTRVPCIRMKR